MLWRAKTSTCRWRRGFRQHGHLFLLDPFGKVLEFLGQRARNSASDVSCKCLQRLFLVFCKRIVFAAERLQFLPANFVKSVAPRRVPRAAYGETLALPPARSGPHPP